MDGTGLLFEPLLRVLPSAVKVTVVRYAPSPSAGYNESVSAIRRELPQDSPFVMVAESFSGPAALRTADLRPPGLRGVVLCSTFVRSPVPAPLRDLHPLVIPALFRVRLWPLVRTLLLGPRPPEDAAALLRTLVREVPSDVLASRAQAVMGVDVRDELRRCPAPILCLTAGDDRVVPWWCADLICALRPDVKHVVLRGPHLLLQTAPREAAAAILAFAASLG